jgi:hypothetical protein
MESNSGPERRKDVRAYASPPAQIVRIGSGEKVEILNASYRGLFIRTYGPPPMTGQLLKIRISLPTATIEINAVPVRVVNEGGRPGVGVRFFALNGEDKRHWESYINGLLQRGVRTAA